MSEGKYIGRGQQMSNIVAEYRGILAALAFLRAEGLQQEPILGRGDCQLVVYQMAGTYRIRKGIYVPWAHKALRVKEYFPKLKVEWIPREQNGVADKLSKDVLLKRGIRFRIQPTEWENGWHENSKLQGVREADCVGSDGGREKDSTGSGAAILQVQAGGGQRGGHPPVDDGRDVSRCSDRERRSDDLPFRHVPEGE